MSSMAYPINDSRSPQCKRLNQHVGAFIASLGGFALGVAIGWHSSAGGILRNTLKNSTATEINLVGGGLYIGASFGVLFLPLVLKHLSHTTTMFLTIPLFIIGWTFICLADQKISSLVIGRVICGMCGAAHSVLAPLYVSEIADKDIRGRLQTFFHLLVNCGIFYAYLVAHIIDEDETIWRYSMLCGVTCVSITMINFIPESPVHLLNQSDERNAYRSVRWLKGKHLIAEEMRELQQYVSAKNSPRSLLKLMTNRQVLRSFFVSFCVMITQQLSGINVIIPNALTVFNVGGSGDMSGSQQTIVVGAVQIVSCILAAILVDIVGRRILLTVSSIMMGVFLILLGWYFHVRVKDIEFEEVYYWMPPVLIILLFASFNIGVGPISWSILGDSFPEEMKITAASSFAAFSWLISLFSTMYFGEVYGALGMTKTLFLFALFCWMGSILAATFVPNTHGKSLGEIQKWFGPIEPGPSPDEIPPIQNDIYRTESELRTNV